MQITPLHRLGVLALASFAIFALPALAFAGSQNFTSSGTFTVPSYGSLTVTVNGAGGGGAGGAGGSAWLSSGEYCNSATNPYALGGSGGSGGASSFASSVTVSGGSGGGGSGGQYASQNGSAGSSGTASGGDTNTTGGGSGGGGGGAGGNGSQASGGSGGSGGAGGKAVKTWASGGAGAPTTGQNITVTVGSGGSGGAGSPAGSIDPFCGGYTSDGSNGSGGTAGSVSITWTLPSSSRNLSINKAVSVVGNITVSSNLTKGSGTFVIDNPADPANELLYHSFVESPDALNEYAGTAVIGKDGMATIRLPAYFEALNKDFQYFLRPIDAPMPELHVKHEVKDNTFVVGGGLPGKEISWMVTGIRHDPYILAHSIIPEVEKGPDQLVDKGEYLFSGNAPNCSTFFGCLLDVFKRWF